MNEAIASTGKRVRSKPEDLSDAISQMDNITNRLAKMLARAESGDISNAQNRIEKDQLVPMPPPCLGDLLSHGAGAMHEKMDRQIALLNQLEELLFG